MSKKNFTLSSDVWLYPGMAGWHFLSVPKRDSAIIKKEFGAKKRGWGSLPVTVTIGTSTWKTSIFPDKKSDTYLLPLKASVRKKEAIRAKDRVTFALKLLV